METAIWDKGCFSVHKLQRYIETEEYCGFDPYDGLTSSLFKLPFFNSNKKFRFLFQQLIKRSPVNMRPFLGIKKRQNPVTLGLCIQAYICISRIFPEDRDAYKHKIVLLINELEKLIPEGYSGACWGYDFDWEARYASIPAYQPTVVATGIITNALFLAYKELRIMKAYEFCKSAVDFLIQDLNRNYSGGNFCFSYSPFDHQIVFNASMKGARLLAQVYSVENDTELLALAHRSVGFVCEQQEDSGAWIYSKNKAGKWVDHYHTGYVLDCLDEYIKYSKENRFKENLKKGLNYYLNNFFFESKIPKCYDKKTYPIDCTAAAQSLLTLSRFGKHDLAQNVALWVIEAMQDPAGFFYYRKYENFTRKTSFMRWSDAWMFAGLSTVLEAVNNRRPS